MSIKRYGTPTKPGALPFSKAAGADGWLFVSGQVPRDADGEIVTGNITVQARVTLENLKKVLESAGYSLEEAGFHRALHGVKIPVFGGHIAECRHGFPLAEGERGSQNFTELRSCDVAVRMEEAFRIPAYDPCFPQLRQIRRRIIGNGRLIQERL